MNITPTVYAAIHECLSDHARSVLRWAWAQNGGGKGRFRLSVFDGKEEPILLGLKALGLITVWEPRPVEHRENNETVFSYVFTQLGHGYTQGIVATLEDNYR
jgi:hypothetical protein